MNNPEEIQRFENLEQQLHSMLIEMSELSRKKPSDGVNKFKLKFINQILEQINGLLGSYRPFADFEQFNVDDVPTNSDIVIMLAQYSSSVFRFRATTQKRVRPAITGGS